MLDRSGFWPAPEVIPPLLPADLARLPAGLGDVRRRDGVGPLGQAAVEAEVGVGGELLAAPHAIHGRSLRRGALGRPDRASRERHWYPP